MKIIFDQQIFVSQKYGGISRYFYEIANRIHAISDNQVEIFAPVYVNEYFQKSSRVRPFGIKRPEKIRLTRLMNTINAIFPRLFLKPRTDVDIFHETYYSMEDYCPGSAKRIITVYDMIHEKFPHFFSAELEKSLLEKAHAIRRADHVICISQNTKKDLIEILAIPEKKISVVYLGCSLTSKSTDSKSRRNLNEKPYIFYVGSRIGYKNFDRLLRAYGSSKYLMDQFDLVCFGGEALSTQELNLMEAIGMRTGHVRMLQGDDEKLSNLYESAAVFVYPSLYEGFGIPVLESMSLGCPVACADAGSIPEIAGNAAAFFNPYDISEIATVITHVLGNPNYASKLVENGKIRASAFSWDKCAAETLDVYQKVVEK